MKLTINRNTSIGGIHIVSDNVESKEEFYRIKKQIELALGTERLLGKELAYEGYHPFGQDPLWYNIGDTIRGDNIAQTEKKLGKIEGVTIV